MDKLYAEIHRWMATPFVWGESDCMLCIADYLMRLGYPDGAAKWRGLYNDALSCERVSGFLKNPVGVMREGVESIGLKETWSPERGDVGVIEIVDVDGKRKIIGAVFLGKNWAVKGESKVLVGAPKRVLASWGVAYA